MADLALEPSGDEDLPSKILPPISISTIIGDLSLTENRVNPTIPCILCDETFPSSENGAKNPMLAHLMTVHKVVIAEVQNVSNFPKYVDYWKERLKNVKDLAEIMVQVNTNTGENDKAPTENMYLLTDFLPEDLELRDKLKHGKIADMLDEQQAERVSQNFTRKCLFCKDVFTGNRSNVFRHMNTEHTFNLGNPDNIVHAAEFLDELQEVLDNLQCLYCEKQFYDWEMLKGHMRKKGHKRVDPLNTNYDKYYLINYLAPGKNWKELQLDPEYEREEEDEKAWNDPYNESEWAEWTEEGPITVCLFCSHFEKEPQKTLSHMKDKHQFDLHEWKEGHTFYDQVKIVNYIRRQMYQKNCPCCLANMKAREELQKHMENEKHCRLPADQKIWNQPEHFFPTIEDDSLLCFLEEDIEEEDENQNLPTG